MDKLLTVVVQTSPLPSHPSTALLEALFRSFDRVNFLKDCNIIILCDGCNCNEELPPPLHPTDSEENGQVENGEGRPKSKPNYKHGSVSKEVANSYLLHLEQLQDKVESKEPPFTPTNNGTIQLLKLPYRHGSAKGIAAAFEILSIDTPYVMIGQHDNFFVRDVHYLQQLIEYMERNDTKTWLQCVHFPSTATLNYVQKVNRRYGVDLEFFCRQPKHDVSLQGELVPLVFWYGRTHIARRSYYTEKILVTEFPLKVSDHLEEIWGTTQLREITKLHKSLQSNTDENAFRAAFEKLHPKYGNYVFFESAAQGEEPQEVLYHLSGRKVHASNTTTGNATHSDIVKHETSDEKVTFEPREKSFTTARRAMAVVPGLDFIPTKANEDGAASDKQKTTKARPKFRQRCFHCGEKGHSFRFCPVIMNNEESMPSMEILNLS